MIALKDLLSKFTGILLSEEGKKDAVRKILSQTLNIDIDTSDIAIKNGTAYLNLKPIHKSEVYLKKKIILEELQKALGARAPRDLR